MCHNLNFIHRQNTLPSEHQTVISSFHNPIDNIGINTIVFHQLDNIDPKKVAITLKDLLPNTKEASLEEQKKYYLEFSNTDDLLTEKEQKLFEHRKITTKEVEEIKLSRIEKILNYTEEEKKVIKNCARLSQ